MGGRARALAGRLLACALAAPLAITLATMLAATPARRAYAGPTPADEAWRPQFHYSPARHWMNDPNGLVWADGEYHLFYQYHPGSSVWGPMHWGHATSRDLLHWQDLPVALAPDALGMAFSGSIVDDVHDTSGFGRGGHAPLVAMYTSHDEARKARGEKGFEVQSLAWSLDGGRTWTKYARNPVLAEPGSTDFRDPKVFWHAPTRRWVVATVAGDHVALYSSADLRHWRHESDFGAGIGAHGGVWECPDLLPLPTRRGTRWLLLVSVGEGAPNGGSGTQYFVGDFDGHAFTPDPAWQRQGSGAARWVDWGTDDYAGSTWTGGPPGDDRALFLGWMSNWQYATRVPTTTWRSAMTLPRELSLVPSGDEPGSALQLRSEPARELQALRGRPTPVTPGKVTGDLDLAGAQGAGAQGAGVDAAGAGLHEVELRLQPGNARGFVLRFANAAGEAVRLRVNLALRRYELDRSASGATGFDARFATVQHAPIGTTAGADLVIRAFVDRSSIELFLDDGRTVMSALAFPSAPLSRISLEGAAGARILGGAVYPLRSAWPAGR